MEVLLRAFWSTIFSLGAAFIIPKTIHALPNPAAEHCDQIAGESTFLRVNAAEWGFCRMDSALIEEWTLYRAVALKHPSLATKIFLDPQPHSLDGERDTLAARYCVAVKGRRMVMEGRQGSLVGVCQIIDGSRIEEGTVVHGVNFS